MYPIGNNTSGVLSGLYKSIGCIVGHSLAQDGVGFPFLPRTCYWYVVSGIDRAISEYTEEDLPVDIRHVVKQVN